MFCYLALGELISHEDRRMKMGDPTKKKCWIHKLFLTDYNTGL